MNKFYGFFIFLLAAGLTGGLFVGCSSKSSPTSPKNTAPIYSTSAVTVVTSLDNPDGINYDNGNFFVTSSYSTGSWYEYSSSFVNDFGTEYYTGSSKFNDPTDVKSGPDGTLYVADYFNSQIESFSSSGTYEKSISGLSDVISLAVNSAGTTLYALLQTPAIETFSITNTGVSATPHNFTYETTFSTTSAGAGVLSLPEYMALDSSNNVYVANQNAPSDVVKYGPSGAGPVSFGSSVLTSPEGIVVDSAGNVLVGQDAVSSFIQEFTPSGSTYSAGATFGNSALDEPDALTLDGSGNLYVANTSANNIVEFKNNN